MHHRLMEYSTSIKSLLPSIDLSERIQTVWCRVKIVGFDVLM